MWQVISISIFLFADNDDEERSLLLPHYRSMLLVLDKNQKQIEKAETELTEQNR